MYKLINIAFGKQAVERLADNAYIPMDEANTDYQEYLKYIAEGGTVLPAEDNS